jgi:hypothetical protein
VLDSGAMARCTVSFVDIEVCATQSRFKQRVSMKRRFWQCGFFKDHDWEPGPISQMEVEIRSSVTHTITPSKVREWLNGGARSPKERVMKERLKSLL